MSLLLLFRRWHSALVGAAYTLRGTLARISLASGSARRVGGPVGAIASATHMATAVTGYGAAATVTRAGCVSGRIAHV